jgi:sulfatase maturation enzyme AslB (radical SAM superfamily)
MKCNLDCSYCGAWSHDNSTQHPPLTECIKTIDFMFDYVDLYMDHKAKWSRDVVLNVYGGESLFHPDIVKIHTLIKEKHKEKFADKWKLIVSTTTNLVVGPTILKKLIPHIDEWTVSYHTEANDKQKKQMKDNLLYLKENGCSIRVTILLNPARFEDALSMIDFCKEHGLKHVPRQLDHDEKTTQFNYKAEHLDWFEKFYNEKKAIVPVKNTEPTENKKPIINQNIQISDSITIEKKDIVPVKNTEPTENKKPIINQNIQISDSITIEKKDNTNLSKAGRACCGNRQLCISQKYKEREYFIPNQLKGYSCSVNWFFLFIKQYTGDIYNNKDCRMKFDGTVGPIGNLENSDLLITQLKTWLDEKQMPIIKCARDRCDCGLCAPKAINEEIFRKIMPKYLTGGDPFTAA